MTDHGSESGEGQGRSLAVDSRDLPHLGRVPIPLGIAGSSIFTGIAYQTREHAKLGGRTTVVTSHNREGHIDGADNIPADYTRYCPREWFTRREELTDHVLGAVGLRRHYHGRAFLPAVEKMRRASPDVVLIHEGHYATASLPYWRQAWPEGRFVLYVESPVSRSYGRRELRGLLALADRVIFVSDYGRRRIAGRVGRIPVPTSVVHNGVDPEIFHPRGRSQREGRLRVSYAGQVASFKGVHLLLTAAHSIRDDVELTIVGSGRHQAGLELTDYERQLRDQAHALGLNVEFVPFVEPRALADVFRNSDVVCVPSICEEAFGRVAVEAMACGAAVVSSARGGLPEACGDAALLIEPEDATQFSTALASLVDDETLAGYQQRSAIRGEEMSWKKSHAQLMAALDHVV